MRAENVRRRAVATGALVAGFAMVGALLSVGASDAVPPSQTATTSRHESMPGMAMPGPSATLKPGGGAYNGMVKAGMAGEWQADVEVLAGDESAKAAFVFNVQE